METENYPYFWDSFFLKKFNFLRKEIQLLVEKIEKENPETFNINYNKKKTFYIY